MQPSTSTRYKQMAVRRKETNAAAQRRRRQRLKELKVKSDEQFSNDGDGQLQHIMEDRWDHDFQFGAISTAVENSNKDSSETYSVKSPNGHRDTERLHLNAELPDDENVLKFNFLCFMGEGWEPSVQIHLTPLNPALAFRAIYERLGLTSSVMESYDALNPIPDSYLRFRGDQSRQDQMNAEDTLGKFSSQKGGYENDESSCIELRWEQMPRNMHPTKLQLDDNHHPFFDLFCPWPQVRDRTLVALRSGKITKQRFCADMLRSPLTCEKPSAFFIWPGDPTDPDNWEVSEDFATGYWFLFDQEVLERTNWWRAKRDLASILTRSGNEGLSQ